LNIAHLSGTPRVSACCPHQFGSNPFAFQTARCPTPCFVRLCTVPSSSGRRKIPLPVGIALDCVHKMQGAPAPCPPQVSSILPSASQKNTETTSASFSLRRVRSHVNPLSLPLSLMVMEVAIAQVKPRFFVAILAVKAASLLLSYCHSIRLKQRVAELERNAAKG
jgi:hypothetical protein